MPWDDDKSVSPGNPDGELTADEWNNHVDDQKNHSTRHENGGSDELNAFDLAGDLVGQGLEKVNNSLQVLSSIWDGQNIVADVDNQAVNTEALQDATDDQVWETWREIGFENGDWVTYRDRVYSHEFTEITDTAFTSVRSRDWNFTVDWSEVPDDATLAISALGDFNASDGAYRLAEVDRFANINQTFSDTEVTTDGLQRMPRHTFNTQPSGIKQYAVVGYSSDGTNAVFSREIAIQFEVQI